jgi:hypothetical protein
MPYILNKTNGNVLTTVNDATVDLTTNLTFVGRNYSGYGEIFNENFLKLLENFSNTESNAPSKPIQGQLWFNSTTKQLNVSYDGKSFKGIASLRVQPNIPSTNASVTGDIWWDSSNSQLKVFDGTAYRLIGPLTSASSKAYWSSVDEYKSTNVSYPILKAKIGSTPVAVISNYGDSPFPPLESSDLYNNFINIKKGITLPGADVNGSSYNPTTQQGYLFWGTAAESLRTVTASLATRATTATNITVSSTDTNSTFYVTFTGGANGDYAPKTDAGLTYNPSTNLLTTTASAARYADLAERYEADAIYDEGTVLVIGGEKEVTVTATFADTRVVGVVSKNPAYMMNSEAGNDETHPYIALKGRVPCKVMGYVKKGDLIVTSSTPGYGCAASSVFGGAVIGKALKSQSEGFGVIEVLVV